VSRVPLGVTLPQFTGDGGTLVAAARRAEAVGLDSVWVFDHLWPLSGGKERPVLECWTALAWLAAVTERIHIGTLVTRSSLRHPAVVAKMAATVATMAPGRVTVAVGSGDDKSRAENEAFGLPYHDGVARVAQLRSFVEALARFWGEEEVSFADDFTSLTSLPTSPRPEPRPSLWIGGRAAATIRLAAEMGDGWNGWGSTPEAFVGSVQRLERAAGDRCVEPTWGGVAILGGTEEEARSKLGLRDPSGYIVGAPGTVARRLDAMVEAGARHLIVTFPDAGDPQTFTRLATEVRPLLRGL
jgi:alkanesulfonate monooxygenase SsuD/methylene tetrahydromethanopterin reductase-like flavin-dependent oxidoreductase (luciferase family)